MKDCQICGLPRAKARVCLECQKRKRESYRNTPQGRQNLRKASERYYAKHHPGAASLAIMPEGDYVAAPIYRRMCRAFLIRFLDLFKKRPDGFYLDDDHVKKMQDLRNIAERLLRYTRTKAKR